MFDSPFQSSGLFLGLLLFLNKGGQNNEGLRRKNKGFSFWYHGDNNEEQLVRSLPSFHKPHHQLPVVPHKAVAEVSKIGHYKEGTPTSLVLYQQHVSLVPYKH